MTDHFALMDLPRRPWLDTEALRQTFVTRSADFHPDRVHGLGAAERAAAQARYTELNNAYNCLRDPKERLHHLLELELGALSQQVQHLPAGLMDLSMQVGQLCREADGFIAERTKVSSPLLKVKYFGRGQELSERLCGLRQEVGARRDALLEELKRLDRDWTLIEVTSPKRTDLLHRLENLCRLFGFFDRWIGLLQERVVRLAL